MRHVIGNLIDRLRRYPFPPDGRRRLLVGAAGTLVVSAGVLLAVGVFLGLYVRPTSDDWCGAWKTRDLGVFGITRDYYDTQNGRAANAFITGLVYSHGLLGPKLLPALLVIGLTLGLLLAARVLGRAAGVRAPWPAVLAAVLITQMLLFFAGTRPYQALLWAPGTISHTLPGVLAVWSGLLAVAAGRRGGRAATWSAVAFAVLMGLVIGTLSEPFTVVGGVFVGAAGVLLLVPRLRARTWYPFAWCAGWCAGLVTGFALLYASPGARWRRAQQPPAGSPLSPRQLRAEFGDWLRVWHSIGTTWAYAAALAVGLLLGLALTGRRGDAGAGDGGPGTAPDARTAAQAPREWAVRGSRAWAWVLTALPVPLVLISSFGVVVGLRQGYGPTGWTYGRAWTNFLLPALLTLAGYGVLAGRLLARRLADPRVRRRVPLLAGLAAAATVTCLGAAAHLLPVVRGMGSTTVVRAQEWDRQDALIRKEAAGGARVVTYRALQVPMLAEPYFTHDYAKDWVAQCVSRYYHVTRIQKPRPAVGTVGTSKHTRVPTKRSTRFAMGTKS